MAFSNIDRTAELDSCTDELRVKSTDYCRYFSKHPYTILQRKECWTCRYSNFGLSSGSITDNGICSYHIFADNEPNET